MKKLLAIALALVMVCALSVSVVAAEYTAYDNPDGDSVGVANPWEFFGSGSFWGNNEDLTMTWDEIKPIIVAGGAKFSFVFGGTNPGTPKACFNFNQYGDPAAEINVPCEVTDLGDGKYEATVELDTLVAAWTAAGMDLDHPDVAAFLIQPWTNDFVLYSAKFVTGADAAAAPAETAPADTTPDAPVEDAPVEDAPAAPASPAETGVVLAVLPMAVAAAAVALSKKR